MMRDGGWRPPMGPGREGPPPFMRGRMPGPPPPPHVMEERLNTIERKLDRILEAVGGERRAEGEVHEDRMRQELAELERASREMSERMEHIEHRREEIRDRLEEAREVARRDAEEDGERPAEPQGVDED